MKKEKKLMEKDYDSLFTVDNKSQNIMNAQAFLRGSFMRGVKSFSPIE